MVTPLGSFVPYSCVLNFAKSTDPFFCKTLISRFERKKGSKALKFYENSVFIFAFFATSRKTRTLILAKISENKVHLVLYKRNGHDLRSNNCKLKICLLKIIYRYLICLGKKFPLLSIQGSQLIEGSNRQISTGYQDRSSLPVLAWKCKTLYRLSYVATRNISLSI